MSDLPWHQRGLNLFDAIVYINLDHRVDRKKHLLNELKNLHVDLNRVHRIAGHFELLNGHLGAVQSHMKALELAIQNQWKTILILEDDFKATRDASYIHKTIEYFLNTIKDRWEVFFLGGNIQDYEKTEFENIFRSKQSICAHAYVVQNHYFQTLLDYYRHTFENLKKIPTFMDVEKDALDQRWIILQLAHRWYFVEIVCQQADFFSDISQVKKSRIHRECFD